jgi:carbon-monoxide dehydrogenase large subunit
MHGAIAQGIGGALLEHLAYDSTGRPLATTLTDYLLPTSMDVPSIEIHHLETPSPFTIGGIKGVGEGGLIAAPAAVVNAVLDALAPWRPRARLLPLTPDRIAEICGDG